MYHHLISLMILFPFIGALLQAFLPGLASNLSKEAAKWIALGSSSLGSLFAIFLIFSMEAQTADLQAVEALPWVGSYAISYEMGIDGLNALPVLLIAILFPLLVASEWNQKLGVRGLHGLFLTLQSAFFGVACAQDLFLMFFFWAFSALPFYFLIGIWGGEKRESAAFRSVVAASAGNALFFAALILIYYSVDPHSFLLHDLAGGKLSGKTFEFLGYEFPVSGLAFFLVSAGLAFRAPVWPFHGWFTHVAEQAPLPVFVALSAATVPMTVYIFVRLCYSLFPETLVDCAQIIVVVGTVNLLVGGICAVSQKGLRLLLAYVCLSEMGLLLVGVGSLSSSGLVGVVYQQLVLGLGLAGFGLFSGIVNDRTGHATFIGENGQRILGGIATQAPAVALVAGVVIASLLGLPGFGGFVGHSLVIIGSFTVHPGTVLLAAGALLLASYCFFTMYRFIFLGDLGASVARFEDLTIRERVYLLPLVVGLLFFGIYPKPLLELVRPTVLTLLSTVK